MYNRDGSLGKMAGNSIRCVGKYLYDNKLTDRTVITVETDSGIKILTMYTRNDRVTMVTVDMGQASLDPASLPCTLKGDRIVDQEVQIAGGTHRITCVSVGNPHCVLFVDRVDDVDIQKVGPLFENDPLFPERTNTEFVRVVNENTLKMRVYERGNGETLACGTGACAAVVAAIENGFCPKNEDITVKVRGGDLIVRYTDFGITLTGNAKLVYRGTLEY